MGVICQEHGRRAQETTAPDVEKRKGFSELVSILICSSSESDA